MRILEQPSIGNLKNWNMKTENTAETTTKITNLLRKTCI